MSTCGAIIKKNDGITPKTCRDAGGFTYDSVEANWSVYGIAGGPSNRVCENNPTEGYKRIYSELVANNPVVVRVRKTSYDHFVTAFGYTSGTTSSNITPSRILIIDPYNPEYTNLQELLDNCGSGGGYWFIYVKA